MSKSKKIRKVKKVKVTKSFKKPSFFVFLLLVALIYSWGYVFANLIPPKGSTLGTSSKGKSESSKGNGSKEESSKKEDEEEIMEVDEDKESGKSKESNENRGKSTSQKQAVTKVTVDVEDVEESDSQEHRKNVKDVVSSLETVAQKEELIGNTETSDDITEIAADVETDVEDSAEALEELEARPKWKTLLFGTDYKNLGQLRSSLAHNTNSIRKLTKSIESLKPGESSVALQEQLTALNLERERIRAVIETNENSFSILGWVFKFLSGYDNGSSNDVPEATPPGQPPEATISAPSL